MTQLALVSQMTRPLAEELRTLRSVISDGTALLRRAGVQNPHLDAEVLLSHALAMDKTELYLNLDAPLHLQGERYRDMLSRRARREPVAYITGLKEFWSLDFLVTPDVLIPRPETELLVEIALERSKLCDESELAILDLGTGSGAIAVSLAKELPGGRITAVDVSPAALAIARLNSEGHGVEDKIRFSGGNLFDLVDSQFDLIVSNPPYVRQGELAMLPPEIREWEPITALDGGIDGLDYYRRIVTEAQRHLVSKGQIILEIGADMGGAVAELFTRAGCYDVPSVYQDYAGRNRVIAAAKTPPSSAKGFDRG